MKKIWEYVLVVCGAIAAVLFMFRPKPKDVSMPDFAPLEVAPKEAIKKIEKKQEELKKEGVAKLDTKATVLYWKGQKKEDK